MRTESTIEEAKRMRGDDRQQADLFSYLSPESRVPQGHPLRPIRRMVDAALEQLSSRFSSLYSSTGRPSIPPEKLLRALLIQIFYSVRSERMLMEQMQYNLLFRWFVGLSMDEQVWDPTVFTKNRDRLLQGDVAREFFSLVLDQARGQDLLSGEHFTVDGTLVEAWAGQKSFKPKDDSDTSPPDDPKNPTVNFKGQKRSNATHASTTDPDARLYRKSNGTEAKLCYSGHVLMDNRHGLASDARLTKATGTAEWEAATEMAIQIPTGKRVTLGADKAYDARDFVEALRVMEVTPHIAGKDASYSMIDGRTTRHAGYEVSQKKRKLVEEIFGWLKTIGLMRKTRHRGEERVGWMFILTLAAYNLVRLRNLLATPA